jgi:type VI secretion system protein VasG
MIALKALMGKLSRTCRGALERAAERSLQQGHFAVEIEHVLLELVEDPGSDLAIALGRYEADTAGLASQLQQSLMRFSIGNRENPGVSAQLATAIEVAWLIASIDQDLAVISSACLLQAVVEDSRLRDALVGGAPELARLPRQRLADDLAEILASGHETGRRDLVLAAAASGKTRGPALASFTIDLTAEARAGKLDPVIGREPEIDQVIEILMRRRQNNPILTGDAGVGKTAIIEGLAQRIAEGQVPEALAGVALLALDLGLLQAGASMKGEFEQRLRDVIEEVGGAPAATILFIDEAHMLVGAGGAPGQADAANLLKPALARGGLRTIAATTWGEYKRYFEKDAALARRFQPVKVSPPSVDTSVIILRHLSAKLEAFHRVRITEEALAEAARMSERYITDRQLPDKAINVLDTACARVAIAQSCPPHRLDSAELVCANLDAEIARLDDAPAGDPEQDERLAQLLRDRADAQDARDAIASRWEQERYTFDRIRALERQFGEHPGDPARVELHGLNLELTEIQQDDPLVPIAVDRRAIADVVSGWTGVPIGAILGNASATARDLGERLAGRIVGQSTAIDTIVRRVQTFQAGLGDPTKPTGVFLLCGPSGVGKTETAMALAEMLFGGPRALITVNMSEYQAAHSVSGLKGAPPGYVGYGKGGILTEAVRRQPYSVVLLDEVEKAHPDVLEIFYQVFDRGMLEDSEGVTVDFTHTLILLTSNVGTDVLAQARAERAEAREIAAALQPELLRHFAPAFLARLVVVPYLPLGTAEIVAVAKLKLDRISERFAASRRGELTYDHGVVLAISADADQAEGGARSVDAIITHQILPDLSAALLDRLAEGAPARAAHISVDGKGRLRVEIGR